MQGAPAYSIGIDLGTTNCSLSFVDLSRPEAESELLPIPQRLDLGTEMDADVLPSFLYLPTDTEGQRVGSDSVGVCGGWVVGMAARARTMSLPDRVAHSAKSWLCHHTVSPEAKILPWKSESVADVDKLSPLEASSLLLAYLKRVWDEAMVGHALEDQLVTITVPASFDVAAQQATLEAAKAAGYPARTRLLEEPQAAFYRWLEGSGEREILAEGKRILVLDIGGGTSDFSLFEVSESRGENAWPKIERVAVSDHILLGGDNIDLALAHALESELVEEGESLNAEQWGHLIARARELKERCLDDGAEDDAVLAVSVPSRGSGLLAGTLSAELAAGDVRALLLDGFFPECASSAKPDRRSGGLLEWGLPYAADCAATRYLADFLSQCGGRVDAVLFNGGTLASKRIQNRILEQLAKWQAGESPVVLDSSETDVAVGRGAAAYGARGFRSAGKILAGLGRAVYLEVGSRDGGEARLLCVLPKGAQPEAVEEVDLEGLRLATNQRVRFAAWQGDAASVDRAGDIRELDTNLFARLPALETQIDVGDAAGETIAVSLRSRVNELGLLQVECVSAEADVAGSWELAFNLRGEVSGTAVAEGAGIEEGRMKRACGELKQRFSAAAPKASRILKGLEESLGAGRSEWDLFVLRRLSDALLSGGKAFERSAEHGECWLQLASFCMRPGFGLAEDSGRLDTLWGILGGGGKRAARVAVQEAILWRRVAGGLSSERQNELLAREWDLARRAKGATAERIRLLGALEKVALESKAALADWLLEEGIEVAKAGGYAGPYFAALGQVLSRTPFRAGPELVLPAERVVAAFERLRKLDWREEPYGELGSLFLRAARVVDDRVLDVPERARRKIVAKLEKSGVAASKLRALVDYQPLSKADQASLYGEALPAGLVFGEEGS